MEFRFKLDEIKAAAQLLLDHSSTLAIRIDGEMGVGKTTLIAEAVKLLGASDTVSSPTFSLVNCYKKNNKALFYHFDFYRLEHPDEALDFGIEEYLDSGHLCFLEWADKIAPHLPLNYDFFQLKVEKEGARVLSKIKI
jgi:tRNA threonylcarbamoyladenosine biosynthesis protein TsaE